MQKLDVTNSDMFDEEYSNAFGDNFKAELEKAKKKAKEAAKKAKENAERLAKEAKEKAEAAAKRAKEEAKKVKEEADRLAKKAKEQADAAKKNIEQTTKDALKSTKDQLKAAGKNIKNTAKELSDKAKKGMKKLLGKAVLGMTFTAIRTNQLGIATRLYPAIANNQEIKASKFKPSFIPKSKMSYAEILKKWKENGGKEEKLNEAIRKGAKLRFKKSKSKLSFDGIGYSNVDGSPEVAEDVTSVTVTPEEAAVMTEETGSSEVTQEQKVSGWNKFLAFIMNIFKKNKASDEVPYEEGSVEAASYSEDVSSVADEIADAENGEASGDIDLDENIPVSSASKKDSSDKILGIPKTAFWIGTSVLALGIAAFVTWKIVKKK
jgi:hypothetical protein